MNTAPMPSASVSCSPRYLRPGRLVHSPAGVWVIDDFQPVAALLDPVTAAVRQICSWPQVPPPPPPTDQTASEGPAPAPLPDAGGVWLQQHTGGPVVRLHPDGRTVTAPDVNGLHLVTATAEAAWCSPRYHGDEIVLSLDAQPTWGLPHEHLVRVDSTGRTRRIEVDRPISWVQADAEALWVQVWARPWRLGPHPDGLPDVWRVVYNRRWLRLPHDAPVLDLLTLEAHGVEDDPAPLAAAALLPPGQLRVVPWDSDAPRFTFESGAVRWSFGWSPQRPDPDGLWRRVLATAHLAGGSVHFDLGDGRVTAASPTGDGDLLLAVERRSWGPWNLSAPVVVLLLSPDETQQVFLAADAVDITGLGWPKVPRPVNTDTAEHEELERFSPRYPWAPGYADQAAALEGSWPDTHLVLTCRHRNEPRVLRRREPLYDELGRAALDPFAGSSWIHALETHDLPTASDDGLGVVVDL